MFKFYSKKGEIVFSSNNISSVEKEAEKYKKENNLQDIHIEIAE